MKRTPHLADGNARQRRLVRHNGGGSPLGDGEVDDLQLAHKRAGHNQEGVARMRRECAEACNVTKKTCTDSRTKRTMGVWKCVFNCLHRKWRVGEDENLD